MIQVGGFGIMTLATLLGLLVAAPAGPAVPADRRRPRRKTLGLGDVRRVLRGVALVSLAVRGRHRGRR